MVNKLVSSGRGFVTCAAGCVLLLLAGCKTPNPVDVDANFVTTPEFSARSPSILSLLPIEDGTQSRAVVRHLTFMRQEINRQLPERLYTPTRQTWVDASTRGAAPSGESMEMAPPSDAELCSNRLSVNCRSISSDCTAPAMVPEL